MLWIVIGLLLAAAAYAAYSARTPTGLDWKRGIAALAALIAAGWAYLSGLFHTSPPV